jgi:hypothetical protein
MRVIAAMLLITVVATGCRTTSKPGSAVKDDPTQPSTPTEGAPVSPTNLVIPEPDSVYDVNGFDISGFEYWPWIAGMGNPYSENRVQFGYDNHSSEAAQACSKIAFEILFRIINDPGEWLKKLRDDTDAPARFFLWNNDYTKYTQTGGATVYNWQNSYIKWQHYTTKDGKCFVPSRKTLEDFAECEHKFKTTGVGTSCKNNKMYDATTIDMTTQQAP